MEIHHQTRIKMTSSPEPTTAWRPIFLLFVSAMKMGLGFARDGAAGQTLSSNGLINALTPVCDGAAGQTLSSNGLINALTPV